MSEAMRVNKFVDFLYGKEGQQDDIGAVARYAQAHVRHRPAATSGQEARWSSFDALKTAARFYGPNVTEAQINAAIAAFNAAGG